MSRANVIAHPAALRQWAVYCVLAEVSQVDYAAGYELLRSDPAWFGRGFAATLEGVRRFTQRVRKARKCTTQ